MIKKLKVYNFFKKRQSNFLFGILVVALIIPSILPLFRKNFFKMHDHTHVARLHQLDKAIKDGHFPVRWSKDLGWGHGMPLFNFYAPFPYYVAEVFHLIGFSFLDSIKICFGLTFFLSFLGMFLLGKKFFGKYGGLLAGIAFVYSPYRAVDFYVRGTLGELFAISLIPFSLWAVFELVDKKKKKYIGLFALITSCLYLSHTVLAFICAPVLLLIGLLYLLVSKERIKGLVNVIFSFILAFGLASFFLIPAYFEKDFTKVNVLTEGFSHYSHHFLYFRQFLYGNWAYGGSVDGIEDLMSFHLGKGHLLLVFITLIGVLVSFIKNKFSLKVLKKYYVIIFFTLLSIFLAYITTYHAKPLWDAVPLMAFIQFPWRFNSLIIVFVAFLAGGGCLFFKKWFGKKGFFVFLAASILILLRLNLRYFRPEEYISPSDFYYSDDIKIRKNISGVIPDYIPIWFKEESAPVYKEEVRIIAGDPKVEILESKTDKLLLEVETKEPSVIEVNRFYFPGWQLKVDYKQEKINYQENGSIKFSISKIGKIFVEISFKDTIIRRISNVVSFISLIVLLFLFFDYLKVKKLLKKSFFNKYKNIKKFKKIIYNSLLGLIIINLCLFLYKNKNMFLEKYDHQHFSQIYSNSQYIDAKNPEVIYMGDNDLYAYAGKEYLKGVEPTNINFEHPPLGKYLIGISILLFNNQNIIMVLVGIVSLLLFYFICLQLFKNRLFSIFLTFLLSLEPLLKSQFTVSMLDLMQLLGLLGAYYFYLLAQKKRKLFTLVGLFLGSAISVKYGLPVVIFFICLFVDQFLKDKSKLKYLLGSLFISLLVFTMCYWRFFVVGNSLFAFIKFQNWLLHWFFGKTVGVPKLVIFPSIFLGMYPIVDYDYGYIYNPSWHLFWPVLFILYFVSIFRFTLVKIKKHFFIFIWPILYLVFLMPGGASERYLILILPFIYLTISSYLKDKIIL